MPRDISVRHVALTQQFLVRQWLVGVLRVGYGRQGGAGRLEEDYELLEVAVESSEDATRLVLSGDLDITSAPLLDARMAAIRPLTSPLTFDVADLLFVDSSGLRALTSARRAALDDVGGPVRMIGCRDSLRKLLEMTGLADAFAQA